MPTDNPTTEPADVFYNKPESTEPVEPTVDPDITKAEAQEPQQEVEDLEKPEEAEAKAKAESEESEADDDGEDALYVEIYGEDHNVKDVKKWRDGHLMQCDYTKKTTDHARNVETWNAERDSERENLTKERSEVSDMRDQLSALVSEDEEINWAELKDEDPDRYIELKEKADKRRETLEKIKAERETPADDPALIQDEQRKLFAANPEWVDEEGKPTESYSKDAALMNDYANKAGFTTEEFSKMTRSHYLITVLKAAKFDQLQAKGKKIKEKREKAPIVSKPSAKKTISGPKPAHEVFYGT